MLAGRRGLSPVMVGRAAPLGRLAGLVQAARPGAGDDIDDAEGDGEAAGQPVVVLVAGEAGVGKSRLLRELLAAVPADTVVLAGQAEPGSLGRPLDVVHSLLGDAPTGAGDPRTLALDAVLGRIRGRRALVVFEDLHWADAESVAAFEVLAAAPLPGLTLVGTYRPDELTRGLPGAEMLVRLERRHQVQTVHLERLTRVEVGAFLAAVYGRPLPTGVVEALWRRTGGNPFFLEEILAAAGDVAPEALADQPLPWTLAEVVRRQLDGLSPDERRVIEAAAVLGPRAPFDVLAVLTRTTEDELIAHLRALVERGLLVEEDDDEFSFRHALVRDAVEGQLLGRERRRLHQQALAALREAACTDLADLARHAAGAGRYDELVELARRGVVHYLGIGSTHQALRLASHALAEAPDDLDLRAGAARAAWLIGAFDEALGHAQRLLALTAAGPRECRSEALRLAARIHHERNERAEMWAAVAELQELVDAVDDGREQALAMAAIAQINMLHLRTADALAWAERAIAAAEAVGAAEVRVQAMVERASALVDVAERTEEGQAALRVAAAEAERLGEWVLAARALSNLTQSDWLFTAEGRRVVERMREAGQRAGYDTMVFTCYLARRAEMEMFDGDLAAAHRFLDRAHDLAMPGVSSAYPNALRASLLLEQDRRAEAEAVVAQLPHDPGDCSSTNLVSAVLRLKVAARGGDAGAAKATYAALAGQPWVLTYPHPPADVMDAVEALLAVMPAPEVEPLLAPLLAGRHGEAAQAALTATAAAGRGDHDGVRAALGDRDRLDAVLAEVPAYRGATLLLALARAEAAASRLGEARHHARRARGLLERWPGWRRDQVDALLQRLEAAGGGEGEGELTPREREVAALLAEGLTNADLARRLYISPKTAAVHVSNILTKLGMASRAEVAAWAVRSGLTADTPV